MKGCSSLGIVYLILLGADTKCLVFALYNRIVVGLHISKTNLFIIKLRG